MGKRPPPPYPQNVDNLPFFWNPSLKLNLPFKGMHELATLDVCVNTTMDILALGLCTPMHISSQRKALYLGSLVACIFNAHKMITRQ